MKGVELSVNTAFLIILIVLALIVSILFLTGVWKPSSLHLRLTSVKDEACRQLINNGCSSASNVFINDFDADKDGTINEGGLATDGCGSRNTKNANDNLFMLCKCFYNKLTNDDCKTFCGCD